MSGPVSNLNMDFDRSVAIRIDELEWLPSPGGEVERRMLERQFAESGRATSIVRYPPGSRFRPHQHPGGEEFLVLEGVFSDEHGDYGPGTYVRNPIGSSHAPFSDPGCVIFVKLWQMRPEQDRRVVLETSTDNELLLYEDGRERVVHVHATKAVELSLTGSELLLTRGRLELSDGSYSTLSWLRTARAQARRGLLEQGSSCWIKRGHLEAPQP